MATPTILQAHRPRRAPLLIFAWLGGVVFVGSLFYFAYFYGVRLGHSPGAADPWAPPADPGAGGMAGRGWSNLTAFRPVLMNSLLFAAFAVHHSAMARDAAKRWLARCIPSALERTLYVWVASVLFILVCWAWQDIPGELYRIGGWTRWLFYAAQTAGALLAVGSARSIDVLELAGIRQVQRWIAGDHETPRFHPANREAALQTTGPYRFVRHPIYLGWLLLVFGTPVMTLSRWTFAVLSTVYLLVGISLEERALRREFGAAYDAYARRVRWRVLPGVY